LVLRPETELAEPALVLGVAIQPIASGGAGGESISGRQAPAKLV